MTRLTKISGSLSPRKRGEIDQATLARLADAVAHSGLPVDDESLGHGVVRINWAGPTVLSGFNANDFMFATKVADIVCTAELKDLGYAGRFIISTDGYGDEQEIQNVSVKDGVITHSMGAVVWDKEVTVVSPSKP